MKNDWETIALRKKAMRPHQQPFLTKSLALKNQEFSCLHMQNIYHDLSTF